MPKSLFLLPLPESGILCYQVYPGFLTILREKALSQDTYMRMVSYTPSDCLHRYSLCQLLVRRFAFAAVSHSTITMYRILYIYVFTIITCFDSPLYHEIVRVRCTCPT